MAALNPARIIKNVLSPKAPQAPDAPPPSPIVDTAAITRQAQDLARKRKGVAANVLAGNTGPGTTTSPVLGGG